MEGWLRTAMRVALCLAGGLVTLSPIVLVGDEGDERVWAGLGWFVWRGSGSGLLWRALEWADQEFRP